MTCNPDEEFNEVISDYKLINMHMDKDFDLGKSLWLRFLRGAIAGAVSTGAMITFTGENTFTDLHKFLGTLVVALIIGSVTGALLSIDKFIRSE